MEKAEAWKSGQLLRGGVSGEDEAGGPDFFLPFLVTLLILSLLQVSSIQTWTAAFPLSPLVRAFQTIVHSAAGPFPQLVR